MDLSFSILKLGTNSINFNSSLLLLNISGLNYDDENGSYDMSQAQKLRLYLSGSYLENQNHFDYNFLMYG